METDSICPGCRSSAWWISTDWSSTSRRAASFFTTEHFEGLDLRGRAVLLRTGWDRHWGTDTYGNGQHAYLDEAGARALAAVEPALVGIDGQNIDSTSDPARPAHTVLLGAEIPIVEHLTGLDALPSDGFRFTAAPPLVTGMGTFPVRAFAVIE